VSLTCVSDERCATAVALNNWKHGHTSFKAHHSNSYITLPAIPTDQLQMPVPSTTLRLFSPSPDRKTSKSLPQRLLTPGFPTASIALDTNKGWVNPWMTPLPNPSSEAQPSHPPKMQGQSLKIGTYVAFQLDRNKIADIMGLRDGSEERKAVLEFQTRRYG
jgi:hypothetical protein